MRHLKIVSSYDDLEVERRANSILAEADSLGWTVSDIQLTTTPAQDPADNCPILYKTVLLVFDDSIPPPF